MPWKVKRKTAEKMKKLHILVPLVALFPAVLNKRPLIFALHWAPQMSTNAAASDEY